MRHRWIALLALVLAGCGQPLQLNPTSVARPTRPAVPATPRPSIVADTAIASAVPGQEATGLPVPLPATVRATPAATAGVPEPATAGGTPVAPVESATTIVVVPRTPAPLNNQDRWRAQQLDRQVLEQAQTYVAKRPAPLLWYDPATGQSLEIGTLIGDFIVQARFNLRSTSSLALEVPYRINGDYGLTAISDAVRGRMQAAGYTESVEAYVIQTEDVAPK